MGKNKASKKFGDFLKMSKLTHNTGLKIISLLFAVIFWVYVMDQVNPVMTQTREHVKVELLNRGQLIQNGLVLMDQDDYFVDVKIEGRRNNLFEATSDTIVATADLEGYGKGKLNIPINVKSTSADLSIVSLSKQDIKVFLDKLVEIEKTVKLDLKGNPQSGYVQGKLFINPQEILVKGPETYVNSVAALEAVLNLDGFDAGVTREIPIKPVDNDGNIVKGVELGESYIKAHIDIWKGERLSITPNIKGDVKRGYAIVDVKVVPDVIDIQGAKDTISAINKIKTKVIDVSSMTQSTDIRVGLELPERVESQSVDTVLVKIIVEPLETRVIEIPVENMSLINMPENLEVDKDGLTGKLSILIEDVPSVLEKLEVNNFDIKVNMQDVKVGKNRKIPLVINSDDEVRTIAILENRVIISLNDKNKDLEQNIDNNLDNN